MRLCQAATGTWGVAGTVGNLCEMSTSARGGLDWKQLWKSEDFIVLA